MPKVLLRCFNLEEMEGEFVVVFFERKCYTEAVIEMVHFDKE